MTVWVVAEGTDGTLHAAETRARAMELVGAILGGGYVKNGLTQTIFRDGRKKETFVAHSVSAHATVSVWELPTEWELPEEEGR